MKNRLSFLSNSSAFSSGNVMQLNWHPVILSLSCCRRSPLLKPIVNPGLHQIGMYYASLPKVCIVHGCGYYSCSNTAKFMVWAFTPHVSLLFFVKHILNPPIRAKGVPGAITEYRVQNWGFATKLSTTFFRAASINLDMRLAIY